VSLIGQHSRATRLAFVVAGAGSAAWAPLVPFAKLRTGLDEGGLGLLLLCLGLGSLIAMPLTGLLTARLGCRIVILMSGAIVVVALPLLALFETWPAMALALGLFGAGVGVLDVAMNIQAAKVEQSAGRAMMSSFHGMFSLGGIAGAAGASALIWAGWAPLPTALLIALCCTVLLGLSAPGHLPPGAVAAPSGPALAWPRGGVAFLGAMAAICFLAEGAILDWGALFLIQSRDAAPGPAGLGYAVFAVAMTLTRLVGDRVRAALGDSTVILVGGLVSALGFGVALAIPMLSASLIGFFLIGLGAANIVPVLFSLAGRARSMPPPLAIAAITTMGYAGLLAGPALIGGVAQALGLGLALGMVGFALLLVGLAHLRILGSG
jgi:hypothetical protein